MLFVLFLFVFDMLCLVFEGYLFGDFDVFVVMWVEFGVVVYIFNGELFVLCDLWMCMFVYCGLWLLFGYGYWVICEKVLGCYVGDFGFVDFYWNIELLICGVLEVGWVLVMWV